MAIREPLRPWRAVKLMMAVTLMMGAMSAAGLALGEGPAGAAGATPATGPVGKAGPVPAGSENLGPAASSTPLSLDVVLSPRDPAALDAFLQQLYDPGSPQYHRFLAKGAFGPEFGASATTIARVSSALRSAGLNPGTVDPNDLIIPVQTTVSVAQSAFNVQIDSYQLPSGRRAYANTASPQVLSSIAPDLIDVAGLSNVAQLQPSERKPSAGADALPRSQAQLVSETSGPTPCSAASGVSGSYTANQLAHAYGFDTGAYDEGQLGADQTIALFELEPFSSSDIGTYQTCYGISTNDAMVNVTVKSVDGGAGSGSGSGEAALDIEDVTGLAPAASIDVYEAPNTETGVLDEYAQIADDDSAQVVSSSWGLCEHSEGMSTAESEETDFEQMAAQGQSMLAAAGDDGSEGCGTDSLAVDDPASDPYVTGVGGTTLSSIGPPPTETVWNESARHAGAGGGGISSFWPMPSWQTTVGVNADSSATPCGAPAGSYCREVPDVSASADPYDGYTIYYKNDWQAIGGTSGAAPLWAALVTLSDEGCGAPAGLLNPELYAHESDLNDITSGNDDYTGTNGGLYPATIGYDMASGLGTPTSALFAPGVLCPAPKLVASTEPPSSVAEGSSFPVAVSVENSSGNVLTTDNTTLVALAITSGTGTPGATLNCAGGNSATATSGVATFSCSINDPGAGYTLTASAASLASIVSSSFTVTAIPPPTTAVLVPSNGATLSGSTYLDASASNATSVEFLLFGGTYGYSAPVVCTATATFYGWLCEWNTTTVPDGSYILVSEAFNTAGSTYSSGVSMTVDNPLPATSVLIPQNDATLSASTYLDASASNATSVEFLLFGGTYGYSAPVVCTATATFYGWLCEWNTTTVPDGSYILVSEAFNAAGSTYSSGVSITVDN
jgi:subtilase family serine protease